MNKMTLCAVLGACLLGGCAATVRYLKAEQGIYRQMHMDTWEETGADLALMQQTLQRIKTLNAAQNSYLDMATTDYVAGNWAYEWGSLGEAALQREDYWAAVGYFSASAYPFLKTDPLSKRSYKRALNSYARAVDKDDGRLERLLIPTDRGEAVAYLHLPVQQLGEAMPVLLVTNGSDQTMTTLYPSFRDYFAPEGWAMLSFDLPGIGANSHIAVNTRETNLIHRAVLAGISEDIRLDSTKVALIGSSFGGHSAVKTAFTDADKVAAAVSICGAVNAPFTQFRQAINQVPKMTADAFLNRFDLSPEQVIEGSRALALSTDYLGVLQTSVPILSINHAGDQISPVSDLELTTASSRGGETMIIDKGTQYGHCPADSLALPLVVSWLRDRGF